MSLTILVGRSVIARELKNWECACGPSLGPGARRVRYGRLLSKTRSALRPSSGFSGRALRPSQPRERSSGLAGLAACVFMSVLSLPWDVMCLLLRSPRILVSSCGLETRHMTWQDGLRSLAALAGGSGARGFVSFFMPSMKHDPVLGAAGAWMIAAPPRVSSRIVRTWAQGGRRVPSKGAR